MKPRYAAFLSYSRADRVFAIELQEWLEGFQVPADLMANRRKLGKNIGRIWRDESELPATSDVKPEIFRKLDESAFLIVICSADAACSQWVNKEIAHFQTRRPNRVLAVLAPGTIYDGNRPETFLPLALRPEVLGREPRPGGVSVPRREPGIADPGVDGRQVAFLRLAAGLLGVGFNDLSDRHAAREAEIRRKRSRLAAKTHYSPAQAAFAKGDAELALKHAVSAIIEGDDPTWSQASELEATATEYAHSMRDLFRLRPVDQEGHLVPILKAVLTPDRRFLLVGAGTGEILVRDGTTGAPIAEIRCEDVWAAFKDRYSEYPAAAWRIWRNAWNNGPLTRVVISPWQECAILTHGVAATVWNTSDWTPTALDIQGGGYNLFAFARSGPLAALGKVTQNETSTLSVINTRTGATVRTAPEDWDPLDIAFSKAPEGESLVIVCSRGTLDCIDPATGKRTETRKLSAERIVHAAFHENGSALRFQAGNAGPSYLRRGSDGKWRRRPDPVLGNRSTRSTQVAGVCMEARRAYTFSNNKAMLVEIPGSRKIASLDRGLNFGSFAPNGRRVLGMRNYQSIELLDSETGSAIASFGDEADRRCHPLISTSDDGLGSKLAWSSNGRWFALECHPPIERRVEDDLLAMRGGLFHPSFVEIREAENGEIAAAIPSLGHEIQFLGFTASSGHIWLLLDKHDLRLRGITEDRLIASARCAGRVGQLAVSYDGRLVAAVEGRAIGKRREIRLFDSTQGAETRSIPLKDDVCRLAFRRSSPELIASMADGSIRLFDIETGTETERFQEHDREKKLTILSIAASGDLIATATAEDKAGPVIVRDLRSATAPVSLLAGERHEITCVGFSEDGSIIACATREGECFAFETATGRQMFRADPGIGCPAEAIAFDGHHNQMTVVGETGLVRCYDATTGEPLLNHTMVLRNQEVGLDASIVVGSERKVIAAESVIQIFNVKTSRQQVLKDLDHKALLPMAISPDGSLLATASTDGAVRIWRIHDGLRTSILRGHRAPVSGLHFFPDGTRLASSDKAGTICIWNIADAYLKGKDLTRWLRARVPLGVLTLDRRDDENLLLRDVLGENGPGTRDLVAALDRFSSVSELVREETPQAEVCEAKEVSSQEEDS